MIFVKAGKELNGRFGSFLFGIIDLLLAAGLYFVPDITKNILFLLPSAMLFIECGDIINKYFRKKVASLQLWIAGIFLGGGIFLLFIGQNIAMLGVALIMFFNGIRCGISARHKDISLWEKSLFVLGGLGSLSFGLLILFKGLNMYWSAREFVALYLIGASIFAFMHKS